ncbi:MAG: D-aminoacylase [Chloroherpetonaceae bacterium]|nr:D-aminoacylase [Chthonomonadaceae bacterium]MDW8208495.1 D-aminoacylase [Chloroherpetonaceae bacterium]
MATRYDVLIRNGWIVDGTGRPGYPADLGIVGEVIAALGAIPLEAQADCIVDASGLVVAPGFIDIHTHADIALLHAPEHLPKVMQGVTTEVFTNCGLGFAPVTDEAMQTQRRYLGGLFGPDAGVTWEWRCVADFLDALAQRRPACNVVYLIPHGAVRVSVMGMEDRPATPDEIDRMEAMVAQGMEEGAWGLSTGLWYAPMRAASREEVVRLCRRAGFFATHQRDYGDALFAATEESLAIAQEAGVPVQISHLQMNGPQMAGRASELLGLLEQARSRGVDVTCDTYPYTAGSTLVQALLPAWAVAGGPGGILRQLADPEARERIARALDARNVNWAQYVLIGAQSAQNAACEGQSFAEAAQRRGLTVGQWVCALLEEEELRACFVHHAAHEENVRTILQWPGQMVGSDGLHLHGKTHPRLYGTFARILGRYVREERVLTLEQAVHKMTGLPAARLGLSRRGTLAVGNAADIVLFDPETVRDTATFEDPLRFPVGIPCVWVNGQAAKWADAPTGARNGRVLRR